MEQSIHNRHYVYQITNLRTGCIYVGVHTDTSNTIDAYFGSGVAIRAAVKKYGPESFKKEIVETFPTRELALAKEKELVTEEFCNRDDVYNLIPGGHHGPIYYGCDNGMYDSRRFGKLNPMYGKRQSAHNKRLGKERLSGKVYVKDSVTGNFMGAVPITHEKYMSGEWVHVNKGGRLSLEHRKKLSVIRKMRGQRPPSPAGKFWWNDGIHQIRAISSPGVNWNRGRLSVGLGRPRGSKNKPKIQTIY